MLYSYYGNGTVYNPYRIGNFIINNCSIGATGIQIQNTDAYFVLTNVTVMACYVGIEFNNVTFGSVDHSFLYNSNNTGFLINSSSDSYFTNNYLTALSDSIKIVNAPNNFFINNTFNFIPGDAVVLTSSSGNNFYNNTITNSLGTLTGFRLESNSNYNNFTTNVVNIQGTPYNISSSNFNDFNDNNVSSKAVNCFLLSSALNNTLTRNHATKCLIGFTLTLSNNNTLTENTVSLINGTGFSIQNSSYNVFSKNTGSGTTQNCYYFTYAYNNALVNNSAFNCTNGFNFYFSNNNNLINNTVLYSGNAFFMQNSSSNLLEMNYANNNIADYVSPLNNTLINNIFLSNSTNTSSNLFPPPLYGSSGTGGINPTSLGGNGNGFGFNLTLPELTILSLVLLIPFVGIYAYRKLSNPKKKDKFSIADLKTDFTYDKSTPLRLYFFGPLLGAFATIYVSNKHKNLDYFDLKSNELRGKILTVLEDQHFIHFNKLREILQCGVSILKWHIQVLHEFKVVNWEKVGMYKVIYLVEKPPAKKEVNLFYSMNNTNVIEILENFQKISTWNVTNLAKKTLLRKDSVLYHCKKLSSIKILRENQQMNEFFMPEDSKEIVRSILFKKVYYSSKKERRMT